MLRERLPKQQLLSLRSFGIDSDAKEAMAHGHDRQRLGRRTATRTSPGATGGRPTVLGKICL